LYSSFKTLGASCSKFPILDQNDPDLEIPFFPIHDQVIRLTFMPVFQSNIGLDHPDPDTQSLNGTTYHNVGYQLCKEQVEEPTWGHSKCFLF